MAAALEPLSRLSFGVCGRIRVATEAAGAEVPDVTTPRVVHLHRFAAEEGACGDGAGEIALRIKDRDPTVLVADPLDEQRPRLLDPIVVGGDSRRFLARGENLVAPA